MDVFAMVVRIGLGAAWGRQGAAPATFISTKKATTAPIAVRWRLMRPLDISNDFGAGPYKTPYRLSPLNFKVDGQEYFNERDVYKRQFHPCSL